MWSSHEPIGGSHTPSCVPFASLLRPRFFPDASEGDSSASLAARLPFLLDPLAVGSGVPPIFRWYALSKSFAFSLPGALARASERRAGWRPYRFSAGSQVMSVGSS